MAYSVSGLIGAYLDRVITVAELTGDQKKTLDAALGQQTWGNDGRLYVFVVAGGVIAAAQTDVTVNATTFSATDGSGAYSGPVAGCASGSYFWASKASV